MLAAFFLIAAWQNDAARFDMAAQKKDVAALLNMSGEAVAKLKDPFFFLKSNGPYDVGRLGWHANSLSSRDGKTKYIVFTTPLTSEDRGDQVFELSNGKLSKYISEADPLGAKLFHQSIEAWFDIPNKTATFSGTVIVQRSAQAPSIFLLRFSPCYTVKSISGTSGTPIAFSQAGGVVCVQAPKQDTFSFKIAYSGIVDLPAYAGSISPNEVMLTNDYWYPMIARLPCAYDLTVHIPKGWTAVGQGNEVFTREGDKETVAKFNMDLPVTYWSFSAGPYNKYFETLNGKNYGAWSLNQSSDKLKTQPELTRPIMEFYAKNFAPYPWPRWGAMESPHYGGGALEAYSFATYGGGIPTEDPHETGHTWWGGMINCTYLRSLWNESFANYSDGLYRREVPIGSREERRLAFVSDAEPSPAYNSYPLNDSGVDKGPAAAALGYGKGAMVLQVLENEIGTETMIKTMRQWQTDHPKGVPGEWEDYERAVNKATGKSYKWFFDQWVRKPGWADFTISDLKWVGGQVHAVAKFKGPRYFLTCEVMLQYADGKRAFKTCKIGPTPDSDASFPTVMSQEKPVLVSFDPWRKLLRTYGNDEDPVMLSNSQRNLKKFVDPAHRDWMTNVGGRASVDELPGDLGGLLIIGSPESLPAMKSLCDKVGFAVSGNKLTFKGTTIDLSAGGAMAAVDLANGKRCVIALGKCLSRPYAGRARVAVFDAYGRFLRGITEPKTSGFLTFRL